MGEQNQAAITLSRVRPLFSLQSAMHKCNRDQWQQGTKERERSDDVFLVGGLFSLLTFRTPCPLSLSSSLAPPSRAARAAIGCREAVFTTPMAAEHVNHTSLDLFTECMSWRGPYSATGLQQLTAEHFTQCLKEQRERKTAIQNTIFFIFIPLK